MDSTGPDSIDKAIRQEKALQMRLTGATFRQIGADLGISHAQAHRDVKEAIADITRETAQEVLTVELARLDEIQAAFHPYLRDEDLGARVKAATQLLKAMDQRARYLGLYAAAPPDNSGDARAALEGLHQAIIETGMRLAAAPVDGSDVVDAEAAGS